MPPVKIYLLALLSVVACFSTQASSSNAQGARHALLIGGLGGTPENTSRFERFLSDSRRGLIEQYEFAESNVVVLAEQAIADRDFVETTSTSENIRASFAALAERAGPEDDVYILLFGHGSYDGKNAQLNIPRRDLNDSDFDELLAMLPAKRIVFINTASSSGPFLQALSAPGRILITATRTGTERNETTFPKYVAAALSSGVADLDRNGDVSVGELFRYASEQTQREFEDANNLATEHALLDDNGDGKGVEFDEMDSSTDGAMASATKLSSRGGSLAALAPEARGAAAQFLQRKERLEIEIAEAKSRKSTLPEAEFYSELETLFVALARLNESIEGIGGGN